MPVKSISVTIVLLCILAFSWSLYRDLLANRQYVGDLRNRVVGARMEKDGLSPYFYKWKKGDGLRYYDPSNFDSLQVSNITASPFFHHLLYPIAELPQSTINNCWLIIGYLVLIILIALSLSLATAPAQQWLVVCTAGLFLLTEAWKMHVGNGQNYLFIPLLAMAFYYCIKNKKSMFMAFLAGVFAVTLILIKPNAALFFIPFLFLLKRYPASWLVVCALPVAIAGISIMSSSTEIFFWRQYKENITQQIKVHQQQLPVVQINEPNPAFPLWEGIDMKEIDRQGALHPQHIFSENGNVFVFIRLVFHHTMHTGMLFIMSSCCSLLLLMAFFKRYHAYGASLPAAALAGFCLFMISDLFSPVYRHQYYGVQWLFPLLLSAAVYQPALKNIYFLAAAGLLLNIVNLKFMPMEHSLGEYIMLAAFIVLSLRRET